MSKHPPRVWIHEPEKSLVNVVWARLPDFFFKDESEKKEYCEYLSLSEAQEMAERAREEGRREAVYDAAKMLRFRAKHEWSNEFKDTGRALDSLAWDVLHLLGGNDQAMEKLALIDAEYAALYPKDNTAPSKPSPQGGGEKKEGGNG